MSMPLFSKLALHYMLSMPCFTTTSRVGLAVLVLTTVAGTSVHASQPDQTISDIGSVDELKNFLLFHERLFNQKCVCPTQQNSPPPPLGVPSVIAPQLIPQTLVFTNYSIDPGNLVVCSISGHNLSSCSAVATSSRYPINIVVTPDRSTLYVLDTYNDLTICSVDGQSLNCGIPIVLGDTGTFSMALSPDGNTLYVANYVANFIQVCQISGQTFSCGPHTGNELNGPFGIAISPNGSIAYITNNNNNSVSICEISGQSLNCSSRISDPTFIGPYGAALSPDGNTLYVANWFDTTISICKIISSYTLDCVLSPAVFNSPTAITLNLDGSIIYVTNDGYDIESISSVTICSISAGNITDCGTTMNATIETTYPLGIAVY